MFLEPSLWCPVRALHLVSRAVASLLKSVSSQEGTLGRHPPLHSFESPVVGQRRAAAAGMQHQLLQGSSSTLHCRSYPSTPVSMILDIIVQDFGRAAEIHHAAINSPITYPQVSVLGCRVSYFDVRSFTHPLSVGIL